MAIATKEKPKAKRAKKPAVKKAAKKSKAKPVNPISESVSPETVVEFGPIREIETDLLRRHPDNRLPSIPAVKELAESIQAHGQLEPLLIRPIGDGYYQILSGETRFLATQYLERDFVEARVGKCDEAAALRLVAAANGARKDLDPIERAELLHRLCSDDGGGLTQEEAGKLMAVDGKPLSRSAVSNSLRLLKLPTCLIDEIRRGVLPESYARAALPFFDNPQLAKISTKLVLESLGDIENMPREDWVAEFRYGFRTESRTMEFCGKPDDWSLKQPLTVYSKAFFKPSKEDAEQLGIVKINNEKRATNVKLWCHLQNEAVAKLKLKKQKASKKQDAGISESERIEKRKRQLDAKISNWRTMWKRWWLSVEVDSRDATFAFLLRVASDPSIFIDEMVEDAAEADGIKLKTSFGFELFQEVFQVWNRDNFLQRVASNLLFPKEAERLQPVDPEDVDSLADAFCFIGSDAWESIQECGSDRTDAMLKEFYDIFSKDELLDLASVIGVADKVKGCKTKACIVSYFAQTAVPMPPVLKEGKR